MLTQLLIFCILLTAVYLLLLRGRHRTPAKTGFSGWVYAHRGCYDPTGKSAVPENSCAAFRLAREKRRGVELDVHLLADGGLAVLHDSDLSRMTGQSGMVEALNTCQLAGCHLAGTSETIPTLGEVLQILGGQVPIILELKTKGNNAAALCRAVCAALAEYPGVYCMESFDPRVVLWLRNHRPDILRGQLAKKMTGTGRPRWVSRMVAFGGSFLLANCVTRPDFIAYQYADRANLSNQLCLRVWGMQGVSWTIHNQQELDIARGEGLWPIYEGFEPDEIKSGEDDV